MIDSRRGLSGWTFIESIVVIGIIVVLSGTVAVSTLDYLDRARVAGARAQIEAFGIALQAYRIDTGSYPTEMQGLDALWQEPTMIPVPENWSGPYVGGTIGADPWGQEYEYDVPGVNGLPFVVRSFGEDRRRGGEGLAADLYTGM